MANIYYEPEKFDLELVGRVNLAECGDEYELVAVWRDNAGQLYMASNSGCPCCTDPFQDYERTDLQPVNVEELERHLYAEAETHDYPEVDDPRQEIRELVASAKRSPAE